MKILFVSSGNSSTGISPVILNQGQSLHEAGANIDYFTIKGKGLKGYFSGIFTLIKYPHLSSYDIIHAHYSLSAITTGLALIFKGKKGFKRMVVSLMGSEAHSSYISRFVIKIFYRFIWQKTIVKTEEMKDLLGLPGAIVIPNGVDIEKFKPIDKIDARKRIEYHEDNILIVFIADPARPEKNFNLAVKAFEALKREDARLEIVKNLPNDIIPFYLNAADILLITSKREGSVNVAKEAMACNCPVVTTNVGDISWILGKVKGTFITGFKAEDITSKLEDAIKYVIEETRTKGRERIIDLGLDSKSISRKLISVYSEILQNQEERSKSKSAS